MLVFLNNLPWLFAPLVYRLQQTIDLGRVGVGTKVSPAQASCLILRLSR